jgi:SAM-dependent methyltransferase
MVESKAASEVQDVWASGEAYEAYVGRWSQLVSGKFLEWLAVPPGRLWLDVGCGTGALTQAILQDAQPWAVKGIDSSEGYLDFARTRITDRRASFELGDAQDLPLDDGSYEVAVSGLTLNFIPDPHRAVIEMTRACEPGGLVAAFVWDYAGRMQFMRHFWNAATALDPDAAHLDEGNRFPLCSPDPLSDLFRTAGLKDVEVQPIDIWTVFKDFEDYWSPFLGGQGPAPGYAASLTKKRQALLGENIRKALPAALDGSIPLIARAWAVRGAA